MQKVFYYSNMPYFFFFYALFLTVPDNLLGSVLLYKLGVVIFCMLGGVVLEPLACKSSGLVNMFLLK